MKKNQDEENKKELERLIRTAKLELGKLEKDRKKNKQTLLDICGLLNEFRELSLMYGEVVTVALSQETRIQTLEETTDYIDMVRGKVFPMRPKNAGIEEHLNENLIKINSISSRLDDISGKIDLIQTEGKDHATDDDGRDLI